MANMLDAFPRNDRKDTVVRVTADFADKGKRPDYNSARGNLLDKSLCVFRTGELFTETNQPKAIVNALFENAS